MDARLGNILTVLAIVCVVASASAVAQSNYSITSSDSTSVPERTVNIQGQSHTINEQISVTPGEEITVDVSAPDEVYRVYLYNGDRQIVADRRGEGDGTFTFDLSGYDPGSYAITTNSRETDQYEAVIPLLIEGYDVSTEAPSSVTVDESFDLSITVSEGASSGSPASVSAVIVGDDEEHRIEASGGDGDYTASMEAGDLAEGDYNLYATVQGSDQAFGEAELLGLADGGSLTVNEAEESTETNNGNGGGGAGGDTGDSTVTPTATSTETTTPSDSATGTATGTANSSDETASPTATETVDTTTEPTETSTEERTTTDDGAAITPGDNDTTAATTEAEGPGLSAAHLALALGTLLSVAILRRRVHIE